MGISKEVIEKIMVMAANGHSAVEIAKHFGIAEAIIRNIINKHK